MPENRLSKLCFFFSGIFGCESCFHAQRSKLFLSKHEHRNSNPKMSWTETPDQRKISNLGEEKFIQEFSLVPKRKRRKRSLDSWSTLIGPNLQTYLEGVIYTPGTPESSKVQESQLRGSGLIFFFYSRGKFFLQKIPLFT